MVLYSYVNVLKRVCQHSSTFYLASKENAQNGLCVYGAEKGIRTLGVYIPVYKTGAIDHYATPARMYEYWYKFSVLFNRSSI